MVLNLMGLLQHDIKTDIQSCNVAQFYNHNIYSKSFLIKVIFSILVKTRPFKTEDQKLGSVFVMTNAAFVIRKYGNKF